MKTKMQIFPDYFIQVFISVLGNDIQHKFASEY
jgi:hypothetical protein